MMDRYIPARSALDVNLISTEIQKAEKQYNDKLKVDERRRRFGNNGDESEVEEDANDDRDNERTKGEAYRRAMGAALHNISMEEFTFELPHSVGRSVEGGSRKRTLRFGAPHDEHQPTHPRRIDPYVHSHHKVVERTLALSNLDTDMSKKVAKKPRRVIRDSPTKSFELPGMMDDYYLNLISWSKDNIIAAALDSSVYIWNAWTEEAKHVVTLDGDESYISSVSWCTIPGCTKYLAIGTSNGRVQSWDTEVIVRKRDGHSDRVSCLTWNDETKWMTSGSRDSQILHMMCDVLPNQSLLPTRGIHRRCVA